MKKQALFGLVALSFIGVTANAAASAFSFNPVYITNNTDLNATSIINHSGHCSTESLPYGLGKDGVTYAHQQNHEITGVDVAAACSSNTTSCVADLYLTPGTDCPHGSVIATITFNTQTGQSSVFQNSTDYIVVTNGFNFIINPATGSK